MAQHRSRQEQRRCQHSAVQKHQGELQQGIHASTCENETFLDEKRRALLVQEEGKSGHPRPLTPSSRSAGRRCAPSHAWAPLSTVSEEQWHLCSCCPITVIISSVLRPVYQLWALWAVREATAEGASRDTALDPAALTSQPGLAVFGAVPSSCKPAVSTGKRDAEFSATSPSTCLSGRPREVFPFRWRSRTPRTVAFPDSCSPTFVSQGTALPVIYSDILFPAFIALFYMLGEVRAFVI